MRRRAIFSLHRYDNHFSWQQFATPVNQIATVLARAGNMWHCDKEGRRRRRHCSPATASPPPKKKHTTIVPALPLHTETKKNLDK